MDWIRADLEGAGFTGFVPFAALPAMDVTRLGNVDGVYIVMREALTAPTFLAASVGGHYKGKDPTRDTTELQHRWVHGAHVLYVGKASVGRRGKRGLRTRLKEYRCYGQGAPVAHTGGSAIWQLADYATLLVAWLPTPRHNPESIETRLLDDFQARYGALPFANGRAGKRFH
ncbi:hypothetical protein [Corynebacterium variabile]|uniref:hypothetical protein n=1 Tax=Corynebacterium variabile TaxID=1727 RepID=UPI002FE2D6EF